MKKKYRTLVMDIIIFGIGALGSKMVMFFLLPLYTNVLSDVEYGIAELVFTTGQLIVPIISLAIYNGLLRYGMDPEYSKEDVWKCSIIIFIVGTCFMALLTPGIKWYKPVGIWRWYVFAYTISYFLSQNVFIYLKVKGKNKWYSALSICQALLLVLCNCIFLLVFKLGVQGYLLSTIVSVGVSSIIAIFVGGMIKDFFVAEYNKSLLKKMVYYSLPFILNDISWWIIHSSDKVMIEWMIGGACLGLYTAAAKIPSLINALVSIFSQAWGLSSIREYDSTNDMKFYSDVFQTFVVVVFGACSFVIAIIFPFMKIYVGKDFFEAWKYVPLLLVSAAFSAIVSFTSSLYGAMKKSRNIMNTTLIASIINVILNYVFINLYGVYGAIIGTIMAYSVVAFLRLFDVRRYMKIDYNIPLLIRLICLVTFEAILVSLDIYRVQVSVITIMLYILLCKDYLKQIICVFLNKIQDTNR